MGLIPIMPEVPGDERTDISDSEHSEDDDDNSLAVNTDAGEVTGLFLEESENDTGTIEDSESVESQTEATEETGVSEAGSSEGTTQSSTRGEDVEGGETNDDTTPGADTGGSSTQSEASSASPVPAPKLRRSGRERRRPEWQQSDDVVLYQCQNSRKPDAQKASTPVSDWAERAHCVTHCST
jgi:hypothetical protein